MWLPSIVRPDTTTTGRLPKPSSPLIDQNAPRARHEKLAPWSVTAALLATDQMLDLLAACAGREMLATGVMVGRDLAWWSEAMRFAAAITVRQQYLPSLQAHEGVYRARWQPAIAGSETDRFRALADAMPAACRAISADGLSPPAADPRVVLRAFIDIIVDWLVRESGRAGSEFAKPGADAKSRPVPEPRGPSGPPSIHDAWIAALQSDDDRVRADPAALQQLERQIAEWRRPFIVAEGGPIRLCFRLEEPDRPGERLRPSSSAKARDEASGGGVPASSQERRPRRGSGLSESSGDAVWTVRYLVQSRHDPSLLMPISDVWSGRGRVRSLFNLNGFDAREYLLHGLGQAAGVCSGIEQSLRERVPEGYATDTAGAHEFLIEKAGALEQAGFGVILPAWWTGRGTRLALSARASVRPPKLQAASGLSLDALLRVDWEAVVGDQTVSIAELEQLARLKVPLVRMRGEWVQVTQEQLRRAIELMTSERNRRTTTREVVHLAVGAKEPGGNLAFAGVRAQGWVGELLARIEGQATFEELPPPKGFTGTLRPYQLRGYSWLAFLGRFGLGACLADDMGLGKTVQTLALLQREWACDDRRPSLLICPMSVVGNWQKEAERFTPELPVIVHHGALRARDEAFVRQANEYALVVSTYALLHRDADLLRRVAWRAVVLDETQNIKNPESRQAQAARALGADARIALTGTPVENNVGDLWSLMEFLNPGLLGTQAEYKRRFFIPIQAGADADAAAALKRVTAPFILRRLKTDRAIIADLPDKLEMNVFCTLTREQASLYAAVVKDAEQALRSAEGIQRRGIVLATLSKLKQVCNHPAQFLRDNSGLPGRSGKLERLTEMLEEAHEEGDRALVFTQFAEMGALLKEHVQETFGREVLFLHGGVPKPQRDRMVQRFQSRDDGPRVFVLSLKAGGTGLNLTAANHVFLFDRWWNPAVESQAIDRAFRIGQTRNVQVHKFLCVGTLEEQIDAILERKKKLAGEIVGTGEAWLTELSTAELKEVFALRRDAVAE